MLKDFFKKHGWRYVPGILLLVLCAYIQTLSPLALGRAVELAENRAPWSAFIKEAASVFAIAVMVFVTRFGWRWFVIITSREMEVYIRDRLYTHLVYLPVDFYGRNRSGNLMAYAINDVNAVRMMFGMVVAQVVNSLSSVMFSIGRMGIPYKARKINIISVVVDAPHDVISAMAGKIGNLQDVTVKTAYSGCN